jgi:hypothetical protein
MSRVRRYSLYGVSLAICLSGLIWLYVHFFMRTTDSFGFEGPHASEKWSLIFHAVVSFYGVWWFGMLWPNHVTKSWRARIRKGTGGVLFGILAWLILTGCALYYIGDEQWREWTSIAHWTMGIAAAVAFGVHLKTRSPRA